MCRYPSRAQGAWRCRSNFRARAHLTKLRQDLQSWPRKPTAPVPVRRRRLPLLALPMRRARPCGSQPRHWRPAQLQAQLLFFRSTRARVSDRRSPTSSQSQVPLPRTGHPANQPAHSRSTRQSLSNHSLPAWKRAPDLRLWHAACPWIAISVIHRPPRCHRIRQV